jgi:hypothetical protein
MTMRTLLLTVISIALIGAYLVIHEADSKNAPLVGNVTATGTGSKAIGINVEPAVATNKAK